MSYKYTKSIDSQKNLHCSANRGKYKKTLKVKTEIQELFVSLNQQNKK